jgi:hypothetical protein
MDDSENIINKLHALSAKQKADLINENRQLKEKIRTLEFLLSQAQNKLANCKCHR